MKPIGIGQLNKAKQKTRHDFAPIAFPLPKAPVSNEKHEGQLSVDVYQTTDDIVIIAPIAGTSPQDIHISITDDVITIKGRREIPTRDTLQDDHFYIQECFWGNFSRSIVLPAAVDTRHVDAHCQNNILTIRIPKLERVRTRVIKVQD